MTISYHLRFGVCARIYRMFEDDGNACLFSLRIEIYSLLGLKTHYLYLVRSKIWGICHILLRRTTMSGYPWKPTLTLDIYFHVLQRIDNFGIPLAKTFLDVWLMLLFAQFDTPTSYSTYSYLYVPFDRIRKYSEILGAIESQVELYDLHRISLEFVSRRVI